MGVPFYGHGSLERAVVVLHAANIGNARIGVRVGEDRACGVEDDRSPKEREEGGVPIFGDSAARQELYSGEMLGNESANLGQVECRKWRHRWTNEWGC